MKQGSTDDPFAEDDEEGLEDDRAKEEPEVEPVEEEPVTVDDPSGMETGTVGDPDDAGGSTVQRQSLPYIHSRDGVKDGRTQRPVFLREAYEDGIGELVDRMESELGEDVYKTDVTEASMAVAQEHPELVLEKLEEWGYGWD